MNQIRVSYQVDGQKEYITERPFPNRPAAEQYLLEQGIPAEDFRYIDFEEVA